MKRLFDEGAKVVQRQAGWLGVFRRAVHDFIKEFFFLFDEFLDFFLHGVFGDEFVGEHGLVLPDTVCAVDGLPFDGGIPPWVEEEDIIGLRERETRSGGLQAEQEDGRIFIRVEFLHKLCAFFDRRFACDDAVGDLPCIQLRRNQIQHGRELAEDERRMAAGLKVRQFFQKRVQLGGAELCFAFRDKLRMAAGFAKAGERAGSRLREGG